MLETMEGGTSQDMERMKPRDRHLQARDGRAQEGQVRTQKETN